MQNVTVLSAVILILLAFTYLISGAIVALFSLSDKDVNMLKTKQGEGWRRVVTLLEQPKPLHASLRIANIFLSILIIILSNILINQFLPGIHYWWEFWCKAGIVTIVLLLFGAVLPKIHANQNNLRFAKDTSLIAQAAFTLFKGLGRRMNRFSGRIETSLDKNDLSYDLDELEKDDQATEEEKNILKGIAKFGNTTVKQIMKTRLDVIGVDNRLSFGELVNNLKDFHYSRLPVYKGSLDNVVGMIHTKDILPHLEEADDFDWHTLIRAPYFIHQHKLIEDLLKEFQAKHIHFATVVDEFGGTCGIVTLEDIMEEIIGDINDEFDDEINSNGKIDENNYVFEGKTMINDVCKIMHLSLNTFDKVRGDSDSLAGLVLELAGNIPKQNEVIKAGDFEFTVQEVEKNRIQKVKVTIRPQG